MRSTESSGVEAKRFRAPFGSDVVGQGWRQVVPASLLRLLSALSPVTLAVGITAFAAATLFVAVDLARELARPAPQPGLSGSGPTVLALDGVLLRGGGALGTALVATGLAWRRRGSEAERLAEAERITRLIGTLPFGVACWSTEGRLVAANERFAMKLGPDAAPGHGDGYAAILTALARGGDLQPVRENEEARLTELHRKDGATLLIEERPLGEAGFVTLVMDVTESRRTNQLLTSIREEQRQLARRFHEEKLRAEAASRAKTSFLAHLSHDIRTPLNHIIGFADMLRQQPFGPIGDRRYLDYVDAMKGSGERLLSFFATILELSELEGGRRVLKPERFTADELLVGTVRRFSPQAQRAGLALGLGGACPAMLNADRFALERMVSNLVENAVRFTPRGGRVTLAAYAAHDGVVIEVTDTGIGMSPERLGTLSQPFAFGDAALTRDREGTGLGIAIARAIAELSGGRLLIDSREGFGTTVAVSLPLAEGEEARAA